MSDRRRGGSWDDPLDGIDFEEFELREPENWDDVDQFQPPESGEAILTCPSCGVGQSASNRHCEQCGARLGQRSIAVAARPLHSVTAGGRALTVIAVTIAVIVAIALIIQAIGGDDPPEGEGTGEVTETTTGTTEVILASLEEITPISISCSSEYSSKLGCENLIDREDTYWNDQSLRGEDAWIRGYVREPGRPRTDPDHQCRG